MDHYREKKLREDYLVALLELHAGNYGADVDNRQVCAKIGIDYNGQATRICQHLRREELVTWTSFDRIALTPKGSREAERIKDETWRNGRIRPKKKEKGACERFSAVGQGDGIGFQGIRPMDIVIFIRKSAHSAQAASSLFLFLAVMAGSNVANS
jgi:hypothetical protein